MTLPRMARLPVSPDTVTVLGNRVRSTDDPLWAGLDLTNAEPRTQSTLMLFVIGQDEAPPDIHLNVPWCHPDDRARGVPADDCRYRVRPKMEAGRKWKGRMVRSVAFERWDGKWFLAIEFGAVAPFGAKTEAG